jgi:hypothetical protein
MHQGTLTAPQYDHASHLRGSSHTRSHQKAKGKHMNTHKPPHSSHSSSLNTTANFGPVAATQALNPNFMAEELRKLAQQRDHSLF